MLMRFWKISIFNIVSKLIQNVQNIVHFLNYIHKNMNLYEYPQSNLNISRSIIYLERIK